MAARQIIVPGAMPSRDENGRALPAFLRFYAPGTSTPKTVYTSNTLATPLAFPLPSDSAGRFPQIWAEEAEYFDVVWSDQVFDAPIGPGFSNIRPLDDALLASADIAQEAADAAEDARDDAQEIAANLGDLQGAVAAAEAAQLAAEEAQEGAETAQSGAEDAAQAALDAQTAAEAARDDAVEIVGFDPTNVVRVDVVQAHTAPEKAQARDNIEAAPALGEKLREKVSRTAIAAGVLTLDARISIHEVSWTANITSLVMTNVTDDTDATTVTLILVAAGGSTYVPGAIYKPFGTVAPTLSTTAGDRNFLTLTTRDGGDTWDQAYAGYTRP